MPQPQTPTTWLFVAHTTLHLDRLKAGDETWWCVDRKCQPGDKAFIYRPLKGILLHLHILEMMNAKQSEMFCNSYQMATARVKLLHLFDPPISPKTLKSSAVRDEGFIRRNFQGKSFVLHSAASPSAIVALGKEVAADLRKQSGAKRKQPS